MIKKLLPFLGLFLVTGIFFWQFLFKGLLPIPTDTIVGLYHPYRDLYVKDYPNGIPFKNFLITDPVRQQYLWRNLSINSLKKIEIPLWNPYSFSGTPLMANFQSASFYPLNLLFVFISFESSWSFLILLQPFLASVFMFLYLRNLKLDEYSSFFGAFVFAFSGFFVTWLEWGTILHTALWFPLILLSIDKIAASIKDNKNLFAWSIILVFSTVSSIFAGHLQTFFYLSLLSSVYILIRLWQKKNVKLGIFFFGTWLVTVFITSIQLIPTMDFILQSARQTDQLIWQKEGWFIPWQHLIQFLVPDFFGNPTTLNYWGSWNYGELTGYAGILPLIMAFYTMLFRKDRKTLFFGSIFFVSLIFSLPTPLAKLPFLLDFSVISTAQPTRLLYLVDFSLAVLVALGLNHLMKTKKWKEIFLPIGVIVFLFGILYVFTAIGQRFGIDANNLAVAKRNMIFPGTIFILSSALVIFFIKSSQKIKNYILVLIIIVTIVDLFRFSWKFNTFSKEEYLYPQTASIEFIQKNIGNYRIATADPRILPPNFSSAYKIASVEGYDPLFINRYAEFVSAINRNEPNINPPFGFNRIVRVENLSSNLVNLMGIKYILSLSDLNDPGFEKVHEEGLTKIYENKKVLPRVFFVENILVGKNKQEVVSLMYNQDFDPQKIAVIEEGIEKKVTRKGTSKIINYSENEIVIKTENQDKGFLVLTDSYYPTWRAKIDGEQELKIMQTDYIFRGVFVPPGKHEITFFNNVL